jgi:hypothetical protein
MSDLELTLFTNVGGPLTKRITIENGSIVSHGSACIMTEGTAQRVTMTDAAGLADLMLKLNPSQALSFGTLRSGLPDTVPIRPRARINGTAYPGLTTAIARTKENILYEPGKLAWVLIDFDQKGIPPAVAQRIQDLGGLWPALVSVLPSLAGIERVERASTSAGLYRTDTNEKLIGSGGIHLALLVRDGSDAERFLKTLHARCWLAGLGWLMVGAAGQLLERSIVDRVVGSPERLIFEGPPILVPPLKQDAAARRPIPVDGKALDTLAACIPLTIVEEATLQRLRARESARLAPEIAKARSAFISRQAERLTKRTGISTTAARRTVERQCSGVLLPDLELSFDDTDLAGTTVADVLADPERFVGETLADPLEGIGYGPGKAKLMRRADGSVWIHSFAHGRTVYDLKYDYKAVAATLKDATPDGLAATFVGLALSADLDLTEVERLRDLVHDRGGIGKRALDAMLKDAHTRQRAADVKAAKEMRIAERQDARAFVPVPPIDAEWLPQINTMNEVLGKCRAEVPPLRDADGACTEMRAISVPSLSRLAKKETNA